METRGTEWGRGMISQDVWANAVEARILNLWARSDAAIVIDDLRFPNDWAMLRRLGGILIRLRRPEVSTRRTFADKLARRFSLRSEAQPSEIQSRMRVSSAVFCVKKTTR